ncbi:MAG: biotin--[acetyl-CoA-carboxylase] ligase [Saccharofermentanales bacterium]
MTEDRLKEILKNSAGFVSGEQISESMGISRTAVWKAVNRLRNKGCTIESVTNKGYRLVSSDGISEDGDLGGGCKTLMIGRSVKYFTQCTSTNDKAREGGLHSDNEGTVYIADFQTDGRGRMGRNWFGDSGKAICMSILLKPDVPPAFIMPVSLLAGLAVCKALEDSCGLACGLKWPNDIIAGSRKIGGILIETSTSGETIQYIVLGIGINCNNAGFPDELADIATSVYLQTGRTVSRRELICAVLKNLEQYYFCWISEFDESALLNGKAVEFSYLADYRSRCLNLGRTVDIHKHSGTLQAEAVDISPEGHLLVRLADGSLTAVLSGEVSLRGVGGYI